jgi:uncharacterized protein (DUF4213/DUF364 family)
MTSRILQEVYDQLEKLYAQERLTAGVLLKVGIKPGWNVLIGSDGQCGMALNFTGSESSFGAARLDVSRLQSYVGRNLFRVAADLLTAESWQERSIGVAALSALSQPLLEPAALRRRGIAIHDGNADFASLVRPDDIVAVVGYGGGVKWLLGKCRELHVTDMRPRHDFQTLVIGHDVYYSPAEVHIHGEQENRAVLGAATAVSITGSSLVNGTFDELLSFAGRARLISIYGSSASLIPEPLFARGIHAVMTYHVSDPARLEAGMLNDLNMEGVVQSTQMRLAMSSGAIG